MPTTRQGSHVVIIYLVMSLLVLAAIGSIVALVIAGDGGTSTSPPANQGWRAPFIVEYESQHGPVAYADQQLLISNANILCLYLDQNHSLEEGYDVALALGMSGDQAGTVLTAAIHNRCMGHTPLLKEVG